MSYTIYFDKWCQLGEEYDNLTWSRIGDNDDLLSKTDAFEYWFDNVNDRCLDSYIQDGLNDEILEQIDDFSSSDSFLELLDSYIPIYNYVHIISAYVDDDRVKMISKHIGNVVIVHINDIDVDGIALTSCGMDFSDSIELAYYIVDGESPVISNNVISLDNNAEKLLYFCRNKVKEERIVSMHDIERFVDSGYQVEEEK